MGPWLGPKRIGYYGIGPTSWQGWLVTVLMLGIVLGATLVLKRTPWVPRWIPLAVIFVTLAGFIGLVSVNTEGD